MTNLHLIKILNEKLLGKKVKFQHSIQDYYNPSKDIIVATHTVFKLGEITNVFIDGYEIGLKLLVDGKHTRKVYFGMDEELEAIDDETYIVIY